MIRCRLLFLFILIAGLLVSCAAPARTVTSAAPPSRTPGAVGDPALGWQTAAPQELGLDAARLDDLREKIDRSGIPFDSFLVVYRGVIVFEEYFNGQQNTPHETYSVTKSFTSTLVGLAIAQGDIPGVDARVIDLLPAEQAGALDTALEAMTVEDLLSMRAGFDWREGDAAYRSLYLSRDWVGAVLSLPPAAAPGAEFNYCSGCSHLLMALVEEQVDGGAARFARERLLKPLGITNYVWETDAQGIPIGGWGLGLTARDMAKFGYLILHEGRWDGEQIVPAAWVHTATALHVERPGRLDYGYQWWVDTENASYAALGRDGQMIYVDPAHELVVVTTAKYPGGHDPMLDMIDEFVRPALPD